MNEQEKQVVQAAIRLRQRIPGMDARERVALEAAVYELITSCARCNTATHICPGCGTDIEHGDHACSNCDPAVAGASATRVDGTTLDEKPRDQEEPAWVTRTVVDVRPGDAIRMPGNDASRATVAENGVIALPWNVHPAVNPYKPHEMPARWQEIRVRFTGTEKPYSFPPDLAVDILLTPIEVAAIELLGWENRIGMIVEERQ